MARRKHRESLERGVSATGAFSTAYASVGSSIFIILGFVAFYALGATPIVLLVGAALFATIASSYAEATATLPNAGAAASICGRAFNELVGFAASWALILDYIVVSALAVLFVPHYLGAFWPRLQERPYSALVGVLTLAALVLFNVVGTRQTALFHRLIAIFGLATQVLLILIGLILVFEPRVLTQQVHFGSAPTYRGFLYALPLGAAAFMGIDVLSNMSEETAKPRRNMPRAMNLLIPLILVVYVGLSLVAITGLPVRSTLVPVNGSTGLTEPVLVVPGRQPGVFVLAADHSRLVYVPVEKQGSQLVIPAQRPDKIVAGPDGRPAARLQGGLLGSAYRDNPIIGVVAGLPDRVGWLRGLLRPWIALLAALVLVSAANASLIGSSRVGYALAQRRQVPSALGRVHPRRMTPHVGVVAVAVASAALVVPGSTALLADLLGFGSLVAFTTVHLAVIRLRYKEPKLARPYRMPVNLRLGGGSLPVIAVLGAAGTAAVWIAMVATHPSGRVVGLAWMAAGLTAYVAYRRRSGLPVLARTEVVKMPSAAIPDIDYEQILVPIVGSRLTDEMMVLACQLAAEKGASIDAVYVIEMPMNRSLDTPRADERERAERLLDLAAAIPRQFHLPVSSHVLVARRAGPAIVQLSLERRSQVIVLGAARGRKAGERLFGDSVSFILEHAPCEVIVTLVPEAYPMKGSAADIVSGPPAGDMAAGAPENGRSGRPTDSSGPLCPRASRPASVSRRGL